MLSSSLAAWPMNLIPPIVPLAMGEMPGPPITPLGLLYWALAKPDKIEKRALQEAKAGPGLPAASEETESITNEECNPEGDS